MPVHWTISHPTRLVVAVGKDTVSRTDIESYLDAVVVAGALSYRKIFELVEATPALSDQDMMILGARIQAYAHSGTEPMGPLAIVAVSETSYVRARMFAALGEADRPLRIFRELHAARQWLDAQPASSS